MQGYNELSAQDKALLEVMLNDLRIIREQMDRADACLKEELEMDRRDMVQKINGLLGTQAMAQ